MSDLYSVIIPCYKNFTMLTACIDSVLAQNYDNVELIITDDCSSNFDASFFEEYIKSNKKDNIKKIIVYSNDSNLGTVKNLNKAISISHGRYIKIIAADDALCDSLVLLKTSQALASTSNDCIVCDVMLCDEEMRELEVADNTFIKQIPMLTAQECFKRMCVRNNINAVGVFFKRVFFEKNGLFDEQYKLLEDWPTWLRIFKRGDKIDYFPIVVAKRRVSTGVVSNGNPYYLKDRKNAWKYIISKEKKNIGLKVYFLSFITAYIFTIPFVRKITYLILKKR